MTGMKIVAGSFGKGQGEYDAGEFAFPDGTRRVVEDINTIHSHGSVTGEQHWGASVVGSLKNGLALASNLDLTGPLSLAVGALAAGLGDGESGSQQRALVEVAFHDGASFVALAAVGLPVLIGNDREVARRAQGRTVPANLSTPVNPAGVDISLTNLTAQAGDAVTSAAGAASSAIQSAFGLVRRASGRGA